MTDILDELERLHAAATQGEWLRCTPCKTNPNGCTMVCHPDGERVLLAGGELEGEPLCMTVADANFIAEAHNHLPALLAYVRAAESLREEVGASLAPFGERVASAVAALDAARARLNGETK